MHKCLELNIFQRVVLLGKSRELEFGSSTVAAP
jgi:hypothetical protein